LFVRAVFILFLTLSVDNLRWFFTYMKNTVCRDSCCSLVSVPNLCPFLLDADQISFCVVHKVRLMVTFFKGLFNKTEHRKMHDSSAASPAREISCLVLCPFNHLGVFQRTNVCFNDYGLFILEKHGVFSKHEYQRLSRYLFPEIRSF